MTSVSIAQDWDDPAMSTSDIELLRDAWAAFERGEIDAATEVLDPDVRWYGVGDPDADGACHNREQAQAFIRRSLQDGISTDLLDIRAAAEHRLVLILHAHGPADWGERGPHGEVVTVRDGKITEMVVYPTVDDALTAAGLGS
jgi:ketosteroid isomerase-like protein